MVVPVRMTSSRFPGKPLAEVQRRPLLEYLLRRLGKGHRASPVIVATSTDRSDDPIAAYCDESGVACYRGLLEDVAGRFIGVLAAFDLDGFVRISGDSPLIDWRLVERAIEVFQGASFDLVTNCFPKTFPRGESVEIVSRKTFEEAYPKMKDPADREHVTIFFYRNPREYRIHNITCSHGDYSRVQLSVDTQEDFRLFTNLLGEMKRPFEDYTWEEIDELRQNLAKRPHSSSA